MQQNNSLELVASISLANVHGRIDHLAYDPLHQFVYIAALGNNSVEVVDLGSGKHLQSIKNFDEPQGVVFIPESNSVFVTNGETGDCDVLDANSFQKTNGIKLSGDADNVRFDSLDHKIYVGYGSGGIAVIDANSFKQIGDIKFSGHPESFQIDRISKKMYVNVPTEQAIVVIDLEKSIVSGTWKLNEASSNFPMCLDADHQRLYIGCRHPSKLLIINTSSGKVISSVDIDGDVDDIYNDKKTNQMYLTCGIGYVDIFNIADPDSCIPAGKVATFSGARTSLLIPELNQLIVASPAGMNRETSLLVYKIR